MNSPYTPAAHPFTIAAETTEPAPPQPTAPSEPAADDASHEPMIAGRTPDPARVDDDAPLPAMQAPLPAPPREHRQAIDLVSRMLLVAQETKAALNNRLAEFDLNDIRYSVLSIVREAASEGCSQSMLAQRLRQSESSISTLVDRMRTSGLLYRLRSKTDRRKRYLTLTERGRQLLVAVDEKYGACIDELLSSLGPDDRTILGVLLKRLLAQLDGETGLPAARAA